SEDTSLSVSGALTITDADAGEAVFQAESGGAHACTSGTCDVGASGNSSYTLDNTNAAVQGLGAGDTLADSFTVTTADGTTQLVTVTIHGPHGAPLFPYTTLFRSSEDTSLSVSGALTITDADAGEAVFQA